MRQGLAEAHHAFPSWLAGFDPWQLAMLAIAVPGPLFFLLVLTMPLTKSGGGAVRTAAVDEHAPRDFLPYARANRDKIGRASCRARGWQYVCITVSAVSLKKKNNK